MTNRYEQLCSNKFESVSKRMGLVMIFLFFQEYFWIAYLNDNLLF
jgi:hypothetical protein